MTTADDAPPGLTSHEIVTWLNATAHRLNQSLTGPGRDAIVTELLRDAEAPRATFRVLATLALLDDCLRVAHLAIEADGVIEPAEITRTLPLAVAAAPRYFAALPRYEAFGEADLSEQELVEFLRVHRQDKHPFGNASSLRWRGLAVCRRTADVSQNDELIRDHERMLVRVMDAVFAGRSSEIEETARRRLRTLFETRTRPGVDPRAVAFCRPDGPEVFSSVAHGAQIFDRDPLDVETIHGDARAVFQSQLEHAITPVHHGAGHGRTLLVLGAAGSGKTHLLRALRANVHGQRLGYVGYLQMSSDVGDYARYVLAKLIDSLERPYDPPALGDSALLYLSSGLAEHDGVLSPAELERLRDGEIAEDELPRFIGRLVDRLVRTERLAELDTDLVQALLLLQRRDPALARRVSKFLRCENLTRHERELLGDLSPRTQPEDPGRTIEQLGRLMFELQLQALVLLVDQIEDAIPDDRGHERVQKAIDVLRRIADALPSAVVVIACLEDVYDRIRPRLTQSVVDRLERDPAPVRLAARRARDEIEAMLLERLEYLYDAMSVPWRDDDALYPFRAEQLDELTNQRARDCLAFFRRYQEQCIAAGAIVEPARETAVKEAAPAIPAAQDDLSRAWNDALSQAVDVPDEDLALLQLLERGARAGAEEVGARITTAFEDRAGRPRLSLGFPDQAVAPRMVEICNASAQGGRLGRQIDELRKGVPAGSIAVALRTSDFPSNPRSQIARQIGELVGAGGVALVADESDLRAFAAFDTFAARHRGRTDFLDWCRRCRPLAELPLLRRIVDLIGLEPRPAAARVATPPARVASSFPPPVIAPPPPAAIVDTQLRLGTSPTMKKDPVTLDVEALKTHAAFLGSTGSGKTTLALTVIEQLLERGISVLLVDRKGDLARYASPAWWDLVPDDPAGARRKQALRDRIDVALYTPGDANGRPLRIPVVPAGMAEMSTQDRDQIAKIAAGGLAAMMGFGRSETQRRREAILKKAIELHADAAGATLDDLRDTISRPDPALLAAVGNLTRHFSNLAEDLDTLAIQRGHLLSGDGEILDVASLLAPRAGRARLSIISAVALADVSVLQFWVSRLLVELGRMVRRAPSAQLRAVAFFDEADTYVPVSSSPPTKDPMFDLLRRARSGGLGVLLASQNPGDFDYRARDNIATWFVGKVTQDRAIDKMRNLIAGYPNVGPRLASQATGSFFLLGASQARELRADHSLMKTEQMSEHEITALARA